MRQLSLTANARYLFAHAGIDAPDRPLHELLAGKARPLRQLIRQWWTALEPEATAGIPAPRMETALIAIAEKAYLAGDRSVSRNWARSWFDWKAPSLQTPAERAIGERFIVAAERLGVLTGGKELSFTHPLLLELYLGLGWAARRQCPPLLRTMPRVATQPLQMTHGRSALAGLALTVPEELDAAIVDVAQANVHVAAWFLYLDEAARRLRGVWLAREILGEVRWRQNARDLQSLEAALASLGDSALEACRGVVDERILPLPAFLLATLYLADHGTRDDVPRLQRLLDEPQPGQWEIDAMRGMLRDAEALFVDEEAQKRYQREEAIAIGKETVAMILKIAGAIAAETTDASPWGMNTAVHAAGRVAEVGGDQLARSPGSTFYQQQQQLREVVGHLPATIERRKLEIAEMTPRLRQTAHAAMLMCGAR